MHEGAKSDHLEDTVNYERVYDCIRYAGVGEETLSP